MPYTVAIRDNATGEVRTVAVPGDWDWAAEYSWTDGNYGCDCNRSKRFWEPDDDPGGSPCGGGRYDVLYVELPDGIRVKVDGDE